MDNKLIMENYLLNLKSTVEVFVHGTLESSNKDPRDTLKSGLDSIMTMQAETYHMMQSFGWYQTNNVNTYEIQNTLNKIKGSN